MHDFESKCGMVSVAARSLAAVGQRRKGMHGHGNGKEWPV